MIYPTIHLNGTGKADLLKAAMDASEKLEEAFQALRQMAPNGRDYYPQGNAAFETASDEHMSRMARLDHIKSEVDEIVSHIESES